MNNRRFSQRGASLIIGLMMLVVVTLIVVSGFLLSSSNLRAAGNMQVRNEAVAAASQALELVIGSPFTDAPVAQSVNVDLNKDGVTDYVVAVAQPVCIRAVQATTPAPSDVELPATMTGAATWYTDWEIAATVADTTTGASATVKEGVRVLLGDTQKNSVCN